MSALQILANPRRIKASHRRRGKVASGPIVQRYYDPQIGRFLSVDPVTANSANGTNFNRYWYGNNNPYKFTDPDGRFGLIGAGIGIAVDFGLQMAMAKGSLSQKFSQVDPKSLAVAGAVGAVTGGLGGLLGKAAVTGTISTAKAVVYTGVVASSANATGKVAQGALTGKPASSQEVAVAALAGGLGGAAGAKIGLNAVANLEAKVAGSDFGGVGRTTQAMVQQSGKIVEPATSFTQQAAQTSSSAGMSYLEKRTNE